MFIRVDSEFQVKNQSAMNDAGGMYGFAMIYCSYMLEISSIQVLRTNTHIVCHCPLWHNSESNRSNKHTDTIWLYPSLPLRCQCPLRSAGVAAGACLEFPFKRKIKIDETRDIRQLFILYFFFLSLSLTLQVSLFIVA